MIFLLVLLPATGLTIAGYFVLYLSSRTDGTLRTFGRYLGFWAFTLAGLLILAALFAAAHFGHHGMGHGSYCPWHGAREEGWEARPGEGPQGPAPPAPPAIPGAESETPTPPTRQ
jgi:hypothetical protein